MSKQLYSNQSDIFNEYSNSLLKQNKDEQPHKRRTKPQFQHITILNTSLNFNSKSTLINMTVRSHYFNNKSLKMTRPVADLSTSISTQKTQVQQCIEMTLLLLKMKFKQKQIATENFLKTSINDNIHTVFMHYKKIINDIEAQLICTCCEFNIKNYQITEIHKSEPFLQSHIAYLDYCKHHNLKYQICNDCYLNLRLNKLPVISNLNKINTTICANYSQCF